MIEQVQEKIDVVSISRRGRGIVVPIKFQWNNKTYSMKKIGLHHPLREGRTLYHMYEGTDGNLYFKLRYNTETLQWHLEAISDGLPN